MKSVRVNSDVGIGFVPAALHSLACSIVEFAKSLFTDFQALLRSPLRWVFSGGNGPP